MTSSGVSISQVQNAKIKVLQSSSQHRLLQQKELKYGLYQTFPLSCQKQKKRAASTLVPSEIPIKKLVNKFISALVEPTAANGRLPLNCPTTIISTALNISYKMPDSISGSENVMSLVHDRAICHIYFIFFVVFHKIFFLIMSSFSVNNSFSNYIFKTSDLVYLADHFISCL